MGRDVMLGNALVGGLAFAVPALLVGGQELADSIVGGVSVAGTVFFMLPVIERHRE